MSTIGTAKDILCKSCGCYFYEYDNTDYYNSTETETLKRQLNNMTQVNLTWAVNATSCYNWNESQTNIADQLALLEAMFACSGWCSNNQSNLYYLFTNINQGKPNGFCYNILLEFFDKFG